MNSTSFEDNANGSSLCQNAELLLANGSLTFVRLLQIALALPTLMAIYFLGRMYRRERLNFHPNLTLLMANIVFFYLLHSLAIFFVCVRYQIIQLTYGADGCRFLTPVWMVFVTRVPSYSYFLAQPLFHFAIMTERLRATLVATRYEREGIACGMASAIAVWLITIGYMLFVCVTALADQDTFGRPLVLSSLTTKYNSNPILYSYFLALFAIFVTIVGDYAIIVKNRNIRASPSPSNFYNLSQNFQVRENIVAMRLILPTDLIYGFMFSIYMIGVVIVRSVYASQRITMIQYSFFYDMLNSFLFLYIAISVLIYIYFIKFVVQCRNRLQQKVTVGPAIEEGEIYFKQLSQQWAT